MQRHSPTLFSLPEHSQHGLSGEQEGGQELPQWSSTQLHLSTYNRTPTHSPNPFPAVTTPSSAQGSKYSYSHFIKRYHSLPGQSEEDGRDDTDGNYLSRRSGRFTDAQDSEDEERPGSSHGGEGRDRYTSLLLDSDVYEPVTLGERERLEWQSMLASVLDGEVLKSEKTRIQNVLESSSEEANSRYFRIWIGLRARLRGRKEEEEMRRLEERRRHIVDPVVQETLVFRVDDGPCSLNTLQQVNTVLRRLDIVQSLYPSEKAFHADRPLVSEAEFQTRRDVLNSWSTVLTSLRQQTDLLRKWTGSDSLDVSQPNTNPEKPIGIKDNDTIPQIGSGEHLDGSTFVERLLKQDSIQRVFGKKGILAKVNALVNTARGTQINFAGLFLQLNLPKFEKEVVQLVEFPTELIRACLRMRLDYAVKVKDPEVLIIDQLLDDFQLTIRLACKVKREYEEFYRPDPNGNWTLPNCISDDFDSVVLEAVMFFFKLLNWKLKSAARDIYFRETDVLEAHWATFNDVGLTINGGTSVIAEQICILTNKIMVRVTTTFERQVRLPITGKEKPIAPFTPPRWTDSPSGGPGHSYDFHNRYVEGSNKPHPRPMTNEQRVSFYSHMLESIKPRYGKLQRFIRTLTQRFTNCAEYSLETMPLDPFIAGLIEADHFLVYTQSFEEEGTYIVASRALRDRPQAIRQILGDAFHVNGLWDNTNVNPVPRLEGLSSPTESADDESEIDDNAYILVLSPRMRFLWTGLVLMLPIPRFNLDLKDNRIRIIADGPGVRLDLAKQRFVGLFAPFENDEPEVETYLPPPASLVDRMAHLPSVSREVKKIIRVSNRLAEAVVDSIPHVRSSLAGVQDCSELLESWYSFASDTGQHAQKHMDRPSWIKFNRSLIRLAISWVSFICDECDPTHQKTFRWAVTALEFTMLRTKRNNILHIPDDQFNLLRQKVASCMTLLISHYDILGARSTLEAKQERNIKEELVRQQAFDAIYTAEEEEFLRSFTLEDPGVKGSVTTKPTRIGDRSVRIYREVVMKALGNLEEKRAGLSYEQHLLGRVLDVEKPEDRSLMFLASSSSNISIRWQQGKFIGAGAFGSVYMAVNLESGSVMAVKEIRYQEVPGISNFLQQIKDELRIMELLHHPNIVEYYGIEVHRDKIYIFEEYCEGGSLADNLEVGRIQDEHILQVYTMQMLEGLSYLHSQNIVHRDIKPDNILLDHLGVLKFVDFGAAKILAKNTRTVQRSRVASINGSSIKPTQAIGGGLGVNNSLTGTPMYMSPEVIKNDKRGRRGAMDIWSMGCVVLESATGRKPWSNLDNEWAIMFHIGVATQHPPLPDKGELSEKGIHFIKQCLTIDPVLRPTADELMEHPWMLDFMETLRGYEEEEMTSPPAEMPLEKDFKGAEVARHAAIIQEKEVEAISATSPSEVTTPPSDVLYEPRPRLS